MSDLELCWNIIFSFRGLLERQSGKIQVIVTFLCYPRIDETGVITIVVEQFDDIQITSFIIRGAAGRWRNWKQRRRFIFPQALLSGNRKNRELIGRDKTTTEKLSGI